MKNKKKIAFISLALILSIVLRYLSVQNDLFLASILSAGKFGEKEKKEISYSISLPADQKNRFLTNKRALQALFSYFDKEPDFENLKASAPKNNDLLNSYLPLLCEKNKDYCDLENFPPNKGIELKNFIKMFYVLSGEEKELKKRYKAFGGDEFTPYVKESILRGLFKNGEDASGKITIGEAKEFLFRYKTLKAYNDEIRSYFAGLLYDENDVKRESYPRLIEALSIIENYNNIIRAKKTQIGEANLKRLENLKEKFVSLKDNFLKNPPLLSSDFPDNIKEKIKQYGIQEIVGKVSYDFGKDPPYRQRNLKKSLSKFDGVLLKPDDQLDYWEVLGSTYNTDYEYGWIISGDREVWAYAGGLCGTSSIVFNAAWLGGLEVVERQPHSILFASLYPTVGIDATVVRKERNLRLKNNTGYPLLIYADINDETKIINFYILGTNPYKDIKYEGPVKRGGNKEKVTVVWKRIFEKFNGEKREEILTSYYKEIKGRLEL